MSARRLLLGRQRGVGLRGCSNMRAAAAHLHGFTRRNTRHLLFQELIALPTGDHGCMGEVQLDKGMHDRRWLRGAQASHRATCTTRDAHRPKTSA